MKTILNCCHFFYRPLAMLFWNFTLYLYGSLFYFTTFYRSFLTLLVPFVLRLLLLPLISCVMKGIFIRLKMKRSAGNCFRESYAGGWKISFPALLSLLKRKMLHKGRAKAELMLLIRSGARRLNAINFYDFIASNLRSVKRKT